MNNDPQEPNTIDDPLQDPNSPQEPNTKEIREPNTGTIAEPDEA